MRIVSLLGFILLMLSEQETKAQDQTLIDVSAGMGMSYVVARDAGAKFGSLNLPRVAATVIIPVEGWVHLKTGLSYKQKGFESFSSAEGVDFLRTDVTNRQKLHYVSVPLQLAYRAPISSRSEYFLSGGMYYGFLVRADARKVVNTYKNNQFVKAETTDSHPKVGLFAETSLLNEEDALQYLILSPSVRLDAAFYWERQYSLSAFWEYDVANVSASRSMRSLRFGYFGLSLGVILK